jgi:hypothetical protein
MAKVDVPDSLEKDEAKRYLDRKARQKQEQSGKTKSNLKKSSSDGEDIDGLILIGAFLVLLGWVAEKMLDLVFSLV